MRQLDGGGTDRLRADDPWSVALAADLWDETVAGFATDPAPAAGRATAPGRGGPAVYLETQADETFQEVRRRYRRFALPVAGAALAWYLLYVLAATTAPGLMARPVLGVVNVAMTAALAQFLTTAVLTWAYARHARLHRDPVALDLRWTVATRAAARGPRTTAAPETRR